MGLPSSASAAPPVVVYRPGVASYSLVEIVEELDDPQQRYALDDVRQPPLAERFRVNHSAGAQYTVRWYRFLWDGVERFETK